MSLTTPVVDDPNRDYGDKVAKVEPGGAEAIPLDERHGKPGGLFWTWASPNLEFATIFVGVIGVLFFGLSFWMATLAIVVGTLLGSVTQAVLSTWGPEHGLPQMILSRTGFGFLGNILPAGINAVIAGIGWFAVNSVSGALALHVLVDSLPKWLCLLIIVVAQILIAFFGHNLIHAYERFAFPVLAVIFAMAIVDVFHKSHPSAHAGGGLPTIGAFLIEVGAAFGYAAGWNPYAADYTRYLKPDVSKRAVALFAGSGVFVSCIVLEVAGAASVTAVTKTTDNPTADFTGLMPTWLKDLTLIAIAVGAIAANALNIYSGSMSFMALGIKVPLHIARAAVAAVFGVAGFFVALGGLHNAGKTYEDFLLVISYWIGPWLGVVLVDRYLRRNADRSRLFAGTVRNANWAGPIAMAVGAALSIWLFSNQSKYTGVIPDHHASFGDLTFEVGFVLSAFLYAVLFPIFKQKEEV